jgi:hypothetical protein
MRGGQNLKSSNSILNTPSQIRPGKQSYTDSKILSTPTNNFKNHRGTVTYHKSHAGYLCPTSPIIPPLKHAGPIATPNRNYTLKTITNYNTGNADYMT